MNSQKENIDEELDIVEKVWTNIQQEAQHMSEKEPMLKTFFWQSILSKNSFGEALSFQIASRLSSEVLNATLIEQFIKNAYENDPNIIISGAVDLSAVVKRDPAVVYYSTPLLYLKGYHALQSYRISHWLWQNDRKETAYFFQNLISTTFGVDVHPAAQIGKGIMFDHATGIVIGETAIVGDNVSFLHNVTLGGTGHEQGDRHPKVHSGVLLGAGASVLGNIEIGEGAKIGAGSVVLKNVRPHTTVAGVPAKEIGLCKSAMPAMEMDQNIGND